MNMPSIHPLKLTYMLYCLVICVKVEICLNQRLLKHHFRSLLVMVRSQSYQDGGGVEGGAGGGGGAGTGVI